MQTRQNEIDLIHKPREEFIVYFEFRLEMKNGKNTVMKIFNSTFG